MEKTNIRLLALFILIITLVACDYINQEDNKNIKNNTTENHSANPVTEQNNDQNTNHEINQPLIETFDDIDRPVFSAETFAGRAYQLLKPWNYTKDYNLKQKYPLLVYLHGSGPQGDDNSAQLKVLPAQLGGGVNNISKTFMQKHPGFVYLPQCPAGQEWTSSALDTVIQHIENLISVYRIDEKRIYLAGYSMGGSGSYLLLKKYYSTHKKLFAGIVRFSGQNNHNANTIATLTSVWIHCGDLDLEIRVNLARDAYQYLKTYFDINAAESTEIHTIHDYNGDFTATTNTLTVNNIERAKLTIYQNTGHGISHMPYSNPEIVEWLYSRKLP